MMIGLTLSLNFFAVLEFLVKEAEVVSLWVASWETSLDHLSVGEEDSVEGEASSLDWVFVHFYLSIN